VSWVASLARAEIVALEPYGYAAWEPDLARLHANELPWRLAGDDSRDGLNRYPEPQPRALIERLSALYQSAPERLLLTRGSDEAIDLLVRAFCRARQDAILVCPPTFAMYAVAARIQGAAVVSVPLDAERGFALDAESLLRACTSEVKLVFLCSPNNPTANLLDSAAILEVANALAGRALIVVDQAYVEFAAGAAAQVHLCPGPAPANLAVLRTLSKAHGLAGARLGTLVADPEVVALLRKVIAPYAITQQTIELARELLGPAHLAEMRRRIAEILSERERLRRSLERLPGTIRVLPSDANFLLVRLEDPARALARARGAGLLVRDVRHFPGLGDSVRVTVGTPAQNERLLEAWQ
jgi:histidinol-phosphate aminotransferase